MTYGIYNANACLQTMEDFQITLNRFCKLCVYIHVASIFKKKTTCVIVFKQKFTNLICKLTYMYI